jgi:hypothetical protein
MLQSAQQRNSFIAMQEVVKMKTAIVTALFLLIVLTCSIAYAKDCSCTKGGWVFRSVNSLLVLLTKIIAQNWDVTKVLVWASVWELIIVVYS